MTAPAEDAAAAAPVNSHPTMWTVHVEGPDDLLLFGTEAEARKVAEDGTAWFAAQPVSPFAPRMAWVVIPPRAVVEIQRLSAELARCRPAAEAYWDAVAAFTTERNHGPLSTTLGWSIRHGEIGEALRNAAAIEKVKAGLPPLREHARLVRSDPAERTYADGVNAACDLIEADLAAVLGASS